MGQSNSNANKRPASAPVKTSSSSPAMSPSSTTTPNSVSSTPKPPSAAPEPLEPPTVIIHKSSIPDHNYVDLNDESNSTLPRLSKQMTKSMGSLSRLFHKGKWRRKRRGSISASFSINDRDLQVEQMNVNVATEEELMTLPGVNRTLANNIINHRALIGGFRKVEDLALVSGMGATKLDVIRPEICTYKRRNNNISRASSKAPSIESLPDSESSRMTSTTTNTTNTTINRPIKCLNINKSTIFDLMTIPGINQALAARIVSYRDRKGPYKTLDDLRFIRISYKRLGAIRFYLTTEEVAGNHVQDVSKNNISSANRIIEEDKKGHLRSSSYPAIRTNSFRISPIRNGSSTDPTPDMTTIFELMSIKSPRPFYENSFNYTFNEQPAYRLATWNMEKLTMDKISNLGVLEVITRTILENGLSVVAMQEICDKLALKKICDELNEPKLARIREWKLPRGIWKYVLHDTAMHYDKLAYHLGVLYNTNQIDEITIPNDTATFTPFQNGSLTQLAIFKVKTNDSSFILVNTLSKALNSAHQYSNGHAPAPASSSKEAMNKLILSQINTTQTQGAIILGHFNGRSLKNGLGNADEIKPIAPKEDESANSNVWLTKGLYDFSTGETGFVTEGLSHLAIPNGWNWGGRITNLPPFWCTLYLSRPKVVVNTSELIPEAETVVPTLPQSTN